MRILIVRSSWIMDFGTAYAAAFKALGHETRLFTDNPPHWHQTAAKLYLRSPFRAGIDRHLEQYRQWVSSKFLEAAREFKPDFIFVIRGTYLDATAIRAAREEL